jgi:cysteinyl-tRNA synthetase
MAGARIEIVKEKRSPLDFVLWKQAKKDEPHWPSPWGAGRPGWHIECSAMSMTELGEQFDIHGGGIDLLFPHHENEIAQSEMVSGKKFANYWMHVGLLQLNHEKMAKSTGNFLSIEEAIKKHGAETIRYFLLSSHYRSPLNYSEENLTGSRKALGRLYQALVDTKIPDTGDFAKNWLEQFEAAMNDDFNTPLALAVLFQLSHEVNKTRDPKLAYTLKELAGILGLLQTAPEQFFQAGVEENTRLRIEALIQERLAARAAKDWQRSDEIRDNLAKEGIELADTAEGTSWRMPGF